jgi:hypothetical protein
LQTWLSLDGELGRSIVMLAKLSEEDQRDVLFRERIGALAKMPQDHYEELVRARTLYLKMKVVPEHYQRFRESLIAHSPKVPSVAA